MVSVRKFDGSIEPYDKQKVMLFCLKMGASKEEAEMIANKIETYLYNEIPTKKIRQMASQYLKQHVPETRIRRDLRYAICLLRPKPDWEHFVQLLMKNKGTELKETRYYEGDVWKMRLMVF